MQITRNDTRMPADLAMAADKLARDHCIVAVKGTFQTDGRGELTLAEEQRALLAVDEHYGDAATSALRYENDFALEKPLTDVLVVGKAVAPKGRRVKQLAIRLEVDGKNKELMVYGERRWGSSFGSLKMSEPEPFLEMPVVFERAFGGRDDSRGPERLEVEMRNPIGVGFHPHRSKAEIEGSPAPNIEHPDYPISSPRDRPEPAGLGVLGRGWQPRISFAGTYDERWREERCPHLPDDFDSRYFQGAPADQQFPRFRTGPKIRCFHLAAEVVVNYSIPSFSPAVKFRFRDGAVSKTAVLDTITLEPHLGLAMLVWRASVPLKKKLAALEEISISLGVKR